MLSEEEVQVKSDELADKIDESEGRDSSAITMRMALDWVLESIDEI